MTARLAEEEKRMLLQGKTLLASDRLSQLAVQESRLSDGHKRTSEALAWLDRRLESDLAASSRSEREAETDSADPLAPPSREETAAAMRDALGHETRAEALRKKIETRGEMRKTSDQTGDPSTHSGTSLSFEAQARLNRIKEGHMVWDGEVPAEAGGGQRDIDLWADANHRQRSSLVHVRPFPDLSATSKAARASAAPSIAGIYDQIFVDQIDETCGRADCDPVKDSMVDCTLVLDENWDAVEGGSDSVGGDRVGRRSHYERKLSQNLAECLGVALHRLRVNEMRPGPSWYRVNELIVDLTLLPDSGGHPPTCKELREELARQARKHNSRLRACMPAVRVEVPDGEGVLPYLATEKPRMSFSFLRGGIVEDAPPEPPAMKATVDNDALLARDHVTTASQHVQYMVREVLPAAQRNADGFWVNVEEGKPPALPKGVYSARYGSVENAVVGTPRLSRQWRVWAAGAAVMLIVAGWVLYLHSAEIHRQLDLWRAETAVN